MARILALGEAGEAVELLRRRGYEVLRAPSTARALGLAKDLLPDVLLVAEADSEETTATVVGALAHDAVTRLLPLVVLAGDGGVERLRRGLEAGASDVVARDADPDVLIARIEGALRAKRSLEELVAEKQRTTLLELAGAVAHKLNQPLTGISVILETLIAAHARGELSRERLGTKLLELDRLVGRMAAIVKGISAIQDYRTVGYLGDVRIVDLEDSDAFKRGPGGSGA